MSFGRALLLIVLFGAGCASTPVGNRPFVFSQDSFAYANELYWVYEVDPITGEQIHRKADPPPTYAHHCFVVAKAARQFFQHADFQPSQPKVPREEYRKLIDQVLDRSPRRNSRSKVIIPGYANLREFSEDFEVEIKAESGGAWQSYFQRGHWRMIMPFSRQHQEGIARSFHESLERNHPPVAHIVTFPELTINHAVLVIGMTNTAQEIHFEVYDPNQPERPVSLVFDRHERTFHFPRNFYFIGGKVDVYEHYKGVLY